MSYDVPPRNLVTKRPPVDRALHTFVTSLAFASLVILGAIAGFLLFRGFQIFSDFGLGFVTKSVWMGSGSVEDPYKFGIAPMIVGSFVISVLGTVIALPLSVGTALFVEFYAPARLKSFLVGLLDLAAAIPSVIFGLWGYFVLSPMASGWAKSINKLFGWIPLFSSDQFKIFDGSPFIGGLVLATMIAPIITAVAREVFSQTPRDLIDGARALGGEKSAAIRQVVLPFGRNGVVGGAMLGLGRALGETVAIFMVLNIVFRINFRVLMSGGGNVASMIALKFGEASPYEVKALLASGFVLFLMTLAVNFAASGIVNLSTKTRGRS